MKRERDERLPGTEDEAARADEAPAAMRPMGGLSGAVVQRKIAERLARRTEGGDGGDDVQLRVEAGGEAAPGAAKVQDVASAGVAGGGGQLPHLDAIQRSFGAQHDVSSIKAHVGGAAGEASQKIGAEAYATGDSVAFQKSPSLHTAAHEAAHVIQQRQGVQLLGGVGKEGDEYERNADAVADRVVAGQSAADLLPAAAAGAQGGVQKEAVQRLRIGYDNTETGRNFVFEMNDGPDYQARMRETGGGKQNGASHFEIKKVQGEKVMFLHTIHATPEEGSGLGTVFMYFMALEALKAGCTRIEIDDAAVSAVGFYVRMGAKSSNPGVADAMYEQLTSEDRLAYESNKALDDMAGESAAREHEKQNYEKSGYKPFDQLPEEEKREARRQKRAGIEDLGEGGKDKLARGRLRDRALSMSGLVADPNTMLEQAHASLSKRWKTAGVMEEDHKEAESAKKTDDGSGADKAAMGGGKKGMCFLTTACVEALGLPDDCHELQVLRSFRDGYMRAQPGGPESIAEYYRIAPAIVSAMAREARGREPYTELFQRLVRRSVDLIEARREGEALAHYRAVVLELQRRYL